MDFILKKDTEENIGKIIKSLEENPNQPRFEDVKLTEDNKLKEELKKERKEVKLEFLQLVSGRYKNIPEATEVLVNYIKDRKRLFTTKDDIKSEIWIYNGGIYIPQGRSEIKEMLRDVLEEQYSAYIYGIVLAKIEADTFIEPDKFFKTTYLNEIPVENGILNIETLELLPFTPDKIFFNKMPVKFDIVAKCPRIDAFLSEVLSGRKDKDIIYELIGFALLNEYKYETAFMFHGSGRNGKGKTLELLKRLFGIENCCSVQLTSLKSGDFAISELFGKRLNLAGDIGNQDLKETNIFKSLTGRDLVGANRKFLRNLNFTNNAKFVFACNELPMVYDLSFGFWARWVLLDFPYTFVSKEEYDTAEDKTNFKIKDEEVLNKITNEEELSGLLNAGLDGLMRLKKNHRFSTTKTSEDVKSTWIRKSNSFIAFCWDNIQDEYNGRISKKELRKKYSEYCVQHKITPKSDFVIKRVLNESYGAIEMRGSVDESFARNDYWEGIKWKEKKEELKVEKGEIVVDAPKNTEYAMARSLPILRPSCQISSGDIGSKCLPVRANFGDSAPDSSIQSSEVAQSVDESFKQSILVEKIGITGKIESVKPFFSEVSEIIEKPKEVKEKVEESVEEKKQKFLKLMGGFGF